MRGTSLECNYYELDPREPNSLEPFSWHKCGKPGVHVEEWAGKPAYRCPEHMPEAIKARREQNYYRMRKSMEAYGDEHEGYPPNYGEEKPRRGKGKQRTTAEGHPIYDVMALVGDESAGETAHWLRVGIAFGGQNNGGIKVKVEAVPHRWNGTVFIYPRCE